MKQITLYSQPGCQPCRMLNHKLTTEGVDFDLVDVRQDAEAFRHITADLGYTGTPVVEFTDADGERRHFHGYQPQLVKELIPARV